MASALANTGAQSNLWGWENFQYAGFGSHDRAERDVELIFFSLF